MFYDDVLSLGGETCVLSVLTACVHVEPAEARRGRQISCDWSYPAVGRNWGLWVLSYKLGVPCKSRKCSKLLSHLSALRYYIFSFNRFGLCSYLAIAGL